MYKFSFFIENIMFNVLQNTITLKKQVNFLHVILDFLNSQPILN